MGYDPFNFAPGGSGNQEVWANDSCDNYDYLITGLYSTWGTGNSQIATANMNQISAVAAGSTYDLAGGWIPADGGADEHHHCPNVWDGPSGGVDVCQDGLPLLITVRSAAMDALGQYGGSEMISVLADAATSDPAVHKWPDGSITYPLRELAAKSIANIERRERSRAPSPRQ